MTQFVDLLMIYVLPTTRNPTHGLRIGTWTITSCAEARYCICCTPYHKQDVYAFFVVGPDTVGERYIAIAPSFCVDLPVLKNRTLLPLLTDILLRESLVEFHLEGTLL
jgi:hypothetical protein